jgi:NADPH2:quinone reductase
MSPKKMRRTASSFRSDGVAVCRQRQELRQVGHGAAFARVPMVPSVHAVVMHETGGPEVLRYEEVPDPQPGEGEVLVRVEVIGVNHYDLNQRAGGASELPVILGGDAAGTRADTGERVVVTGTKGAYAELVTRPEKNVWRIPDELDAAVAAALPTPYRVAWMALVGTAKLESDETLLVQAASSATGQACLDLGRALGAKVFATAGEGKLDRLRELGAEPLAYDDPRLEELEADVVYDPVGGDAFARSLAALGKGGRLITPGALGDPEVSVNLWSLVGKRASVTGIAGAAAPREALEEIIERAAKGELRPVIDRELPLERAPDAHRAIEARETFGKVILRP